LSAGRPGTGESRGVGRRTLPLEKSRFQEHFAQCRADLFAPGDGAAELVWKKRVIGVMNIQGKPGEENLGPAPGLPEFIAWGSRKEAANGKGKPAVSPLPRKSSGPRVAPRIALSSGEASPDKGTPPKPPPAIPGARKTGHLEARFRHSRPAPC
jgi:hypothetical protein